MELRLLARDQINVECWDILIKESQYSVFYAYHWYLDVVCAEWQAIVWQDGAHYQMVMPLPIKRKWGMVSIEQPLFCPYLGLFSRVAITPEQTQAFLKVLNQSFSYISIYQFKEQESSLLLPILKGYDSFNLKLNTTYTIALDQTYADIQAAYFKDKKANIRKSETCGIQIRDSVDIEPLIQLFKDNHAAHITGGVSELAYALLREVFKVLLMKANVELKYGWKDSKIVSGVLFAEVGNYVCYLFNASEKEGRICHIRAKLLDDFFRRKSNANLHFDFESPEQASIASYYRSFGANPRNYLAISKNGFPFPLNHIQNLRKKIYQVLISRSKKL